MHHKTTRLESLDVLRGFTIIAMIIVNDPGSWSHVYAPLLHKPWNGITVTDLIFPFFLFIVGVSIALAYEKRMKKGDSKPKMIQKIVWRAFKIYVVGVFLWLWPDFNFEEIRWVGVLQRISIVFLVCAILFLYTNRKQQLTITIGLLFFYWVIMAFIPLPEIGQPDLSVPEKNWANYLDSKYLPGVMWQKTWDPEGILSTLPSIATGLLGLLVGKILLENQSISKKIQKVFFASLLMIVLGLIWSIVFPLNKNIWTSSFALLTAGMASLTLTVLLAIIDQKGMKNWSFPGKVFGMNAITAYVLSGLLVSVFYSSKFIGIALNEEWMNWATNIGIAAKLASLLYALFYTIIIYLIVYYLYKKCIFIKL